MRPGSHVSELTQPPRSAAAGTFLVPVVGAFVAARKLNSTVRLPAWPRVWLRVWVVDLPVT